MRNYIILFPLFLSASLIAQEKPAGKMNAEKVTAIIDTEIAAMAREVSPDSIKKYISELAAFKTRHSLSDTTHALQGIGAARRWVAAKLRQFAQRNRADMKVELDPFTVTPNPRSPRIPYAVTMKKCRGNP